jgi:hypothetical protein
MSKKTLILIISIIIIIGLTSYGVWYFNSSPTEQKTFDSFIPFGLPNISDLNSKIGGKTDPLLEDGIVLNIPKLRQITTSPIAGAVVFKASTTTQNTGSDSNDNSTTTDSYIVRYMDRATGYIYETSINNIKPKRISNTTIPRVYEVFFNKKPDSVILRYLDDNKKIESYYATINNEENKDEGSLVGSFLQKDIKIINTSPDKTKVFYMFNGGDNVIGVKSDFNGKNKTQIFNFPFKEWLSQWVNKKYIYITTKPSSEVPGYLYSISTKKGNMERVFGDINGLTTLANNSGDTILYSESSRNGFSTGIYRKESNETEKISLTTFPEKCVWSSDNITAFCGVPIYFDSGEYPDIWYQGITSFSDELWKINTKTGAYDFIIDPFENSNTEIDAINLFLSEDENYLFFTNKKDTTLWVLNLKEQNNISG